MPPPYPSLGQVETRSLTKNKAADWNSRSRTLVTVVELSAFADDGRCRRCFYSVVIKQAPIRYLVPGMIRTKYYAYTWGALWQVRGQRGTTITPPHHHQHHHHRMGIACSPGRMSAPLPFCFARSWVRGGGMRVDGQLWGAICYLPDPAGKRQKSLRSVYQKTPPYLLTP